MAWAKNNYGWWLIRASNTEEALIIRFEGRSATDKMELFLEKKEPDLDKGKNIKSNIKRR